MKSKTNMRITIERQEHTAFRLDRSDGSPSWCELCAEETELLSLTDAAIVLDTTHMALFRRVENGDLHFSRSAAGGLLICRNSLGEGAAM